MNKIMALFEDRFNAQLAPNIQEEIIPQKPIKPEPEPVVVAKGNRDYDKLLQYAPLLQQGLITQDEFNQIKADIFQGGV